jgi:hypothetical protein
MRQRHTKNIRVAQPLRCLRAGRHPDEFGQTQKVLPLLDFVALAAQSIVRLTPISIPYWDALVCWTNTCILLRRAPK